jgi:hypothetical protein
MNASTPHDIQVSNECEKPHISKITEERQGVLGKSITGAGADAGDFAAGSL